MAHGLTRTRFRFNCVSRKYGRLKNGFNTTERAKNSLRAFVFNVLDLDNRRIQTDNKKIHEIKELLKNSVILKPDKGEGVVRINKTEYKNSMESLFSDRKRFHITKEDLTTSRLASVQKYLRKLLKNKEVDGATFQLVRPKAAKPARAHRLPKIHKKFDKASSNNRYQRNNTLRSWKILEPTTTATNRK